MAKPKTQPVFESSCSLDADERDAAIRALTIQKRRAGTARRAALDAAITELYAFGKLFLTEPQFAHMTAALKARASRVGAAPRAVLDGIVRELEAAWCGRYPEGQG